MKRRKIGTKEDHIAYLEENKTMDRSIMAFNLQNQFGLKKKEAANTIREWYYTEEKKEKEIEIEEEEEDGKNIKKEGVGVSPRDAKIFVGNMNDLLDQGYTPEQVLQNMAGRFKLPPQTFATAYLTATNSSMEEYLNKKRNSGMNQDADMGNTPTINSGRGF